MSPKRISARNIETRLSIPPAIHEAMRAKAATLGMSLRSYLVAVGARDVGMGKAYRPPTWGGDRTQE